MRENRGRCSGLLGGCEWAAPPGLSRSRISDAAASNRLFQTWSQPASFSLQNIVSSPFRMFSWSRNLPHKTPHVTDVARISVALPKSHDPPNVQTLEMVVSYCRPLSHLNRGCCCLFQAKRAPKARNTTLVWPSAVHRGLRPLIKTSWP